MALKESKTVSIKGSTYKQIITTIFTVTLDGNVLPLQLIYGDLTSKSLPRVKFPSLFSLSANPKHYSNEKEAITVVNDIIMPYVIAERKRLKLSELRSSVFKLSVSRK